MRRVKAPGWSLGGVTLRYCLVLNGNDSCYLLPPVPSQTWMSATGHQTVSQRGKGIVECRTRVLKCQSHKQILEGAEHLCRVGILETLTEDF